ncbi:signal transduction histidine kinase [Lipingzhangella halophila]|uniref:histidine kinase n=1 Tax=Lipingzhangella halophila TaxID=1783352 RepID=A0A7W7REE0_9ACTN|nr:ATP-binding protein [Lipingzhangella halophila]MBB4930452.1 signal transduction histidine kinase [Lipingzhangella halophila]
MSAQASGRRQPLPPASLALLVLVAAVLVTGGAWLWAVRAAPADAVPFATTAGGVAGALLSAAVAVAAYFAAVARRSREQSAFADARAARLDQDVTWLAEEVLPALGGKLRDGRTADSVLAELAEPDEECLRLLLRAAARQLSDSEQRASASAAELAAIRQDAAHLTDETLPVLVRRLRTDRTVSAEAVLAELAEPGEECLRPLLRETARHIGKSERTGAAAMAACASAAARGQARVTTMLAKLRELEDQYGDQDDIFADLLELDHQTAQMGRLADSFAVLSGGRSGRRWTKPIVMERLLRGAMGRIGAFRRIRTHSTSTVAVAGYAAEGVMHTLAELMDNATTFSAHDTEVHVYVAEEDSGVAVTIEDSGLGMRPREQRRAEALVAETLDLTTLTGTRLGLAVVGRLCAKYGLTVDFWPSDHGGTGVVLLIPRHLITQPRQTHALPARDGAARSAAADRAAAQDMPSQPDVGDGSEKLPKRRRGATLAAALRTEHPPPSTATTRQRGDPAARFAAFRKASGGTAPDDREESQ